MEPGAYVPDCTVGITRVEDLPTPLKQRRSRSYRRRRCPRCHRSCFRHGRGHRTLHDLGCLLRDRPRVLQVVYSQHYCAACDTFFSADMADLAPPGSHYTRRVITLAVRLVVEDDWPYRTASWHLWRDHRVFVPCATIENWVEASGKKKPDAGSDRLLGLGSGRLLGLPGGRRTV
jgi:hypothetical protein